jgi:hypothetical protein
VSDNARREILRGLPGGAPLFGERDGVYVVGEDEGEIKYHKAKFQDGSIARLPDVYAALIDLGTMKMIANLTAQMVIAELRHEGVLPPSKAAESEEPAT